VAFATTKSTSSRPTCSFQLSATAGLRNGFGLPKVELQSLRATAAGAIMISPAGDTKDRSPPKAGRRASRVADFLRAIVEALRSLFGEYLHVIGDSLALLRRPRAFFPNLSRRPDGLGRAMSYFTQALAIAALVSDDDESEIVGFLVAGFVVLVSLPAHLLLERLIGQRRPPAITMAVFLYVGGLLQLVSSALVLTLKLDPDFVQVFSVIALPTLGALFATVGLAQSQEVSLWRALPATYVAVLLSASALLALAYAVSKAMSELPPLWV